MGETFISLDRVKSIACVGFIFKNRDNKNAHMNSSKLLKKREAKNGLASSSLAKG